MPRNQTAAPVIEPPPVEVQREITNETFGKKAIGEAIGPTIEVSDSRGNKARWGQLDRSNSSRGLAVDIRYTNLRRSMEQRHHEIGIQVVTVINLGPIPCRVNSGMPAIAHVAIPGIKRNQKFTMHAFEHPYIEPLYAGEGVSTPWDFLPYQLAQAFVDESRSSGIGGVVALRATQEEIEQAGEDAIMLLPEVKAARDEMFKWCEARVREAWNYYNTPNHSQARNINIPHRLAATTLHDNGRLPVIPEWVEISRPVEETAAKCPWCNLQPTFGATKCECGYILDPAKHYLATLNENDPSLERLTRRQVEELGISAYVAETVDERPERLKTGLPKPLSRAQIRAIELEEEATIAAEQRNAARRVPTPSQLDQI